VGQVKWDPYAVPDTPEAGWYPDPSGGGRERYFDGATWTDQTRIPQLKPRRRATTSQDPTPAGQDTPDVPVSPSPGAATGRRKASLAAALAATHEPIAAQPTSPPAPGSRGAAPEAPRGRGRRSLAAALASAPEVDPNSAQALLPPTLGLPPALRDRGPAPAGWYPDPARGLQLRFYDGTGWTSRTRRQDDEKLRRLPKAALILRARILEAQDAAALRRGDKPVTSPKRFRVQPAQPVPSLTRPGHRNRSGSVWGTAATLVATVGAAASIYFGWQLWGSDVYTAYQQEQLAAELEQTTAVPVEVYLPTPAGPSPTTGDTPTQPATPTPSPAVPSPSSITAPASPTTTPAQKPAGSSSAPRVVQPGKHRDGQAVGTIEIPKIGLKKVFVLGTSVDDLKKGPGLWKWGVFPGTPGNATISGHRTTYGGPFRHLDQLQYGDKIIVRVPGQPDAVFEVRGHTIAPPFDTRVTKQTPGARLTLTTCDPVGSAAQRLVIQAELIKGKYAQYAVDRDDWVLLK